MDFFLFGNPEGISWTTFSWYWSRLWKCIHMCLLIYTFIYVYYTIVPSFQTQKNCKWEICILSMRGHTDCSPNLHNSVLFDLQKGQSPPQATGHTCLSCPCVWTLPVANYNKMKSCIRIVLESVHSLVSAKATGMLAGF